MKMGNLRSPAIARFGKVVFFVEGILVSGIQNETPGYIVVKSLGSGK